MEFLFYISYNSWSNPSLPLFPFFTVETFSYIVVALTIDEPTINRTQTPTFSYYIDCQTINPFHIYVSVELKKSHIFRLPFSVSKYQYSSNFIQTLTFSFFVQTKNLRVYSIHIFLVPYELLPTIPKLSCFHHNSATYLTRLNSINLIHLRTLFPPVITSQRHRYLRFLRMVIITLLRSDGFSRSWTGSIS